MAEGTRKITETRIPTTIILFFNLVLRFAGANGGDGSYCENDIFDVRCDSDAVIMMHSARYGRMPGSNCITNPPMDCHVDVLGRMDALCSGRTACKVPVATLVPDAEQPCNKDFRSYLQANYTCVKVKTGETNWCRAPNHMRVSGPSGYLSSYVAENTNLGTYECPWLLEAEPGQTMEIEVWDFAWKNFRPIHQCEVYAILKESTISTQTICAVDVRFRHWYRTSTNLLEVRLTKKQNGERNATGHFLLYFKAIGCGDPEPPAHGWVQRTGDRVEMGCDYSDNTWFMECQDNAWIGKHQNCSGSEVGVTHGQASFKFSSGLSILVIIMIAVAIGVIILLFGVLFLRRQISRREPAPGQYDYYQSQQRRSSGPAPSTHKSANMMDTYQTGENPYLRTWDMRSAAHQGPYHTPAGSDAQHYNGRYIEHIYESPKFDRKSYADDTSTSNNAPQYFELDPSAEHRHLPPPPPPGGAVQYVHKAPVHDPRKHRNYNRQPSSSSKHAGSL